MDKEGAKAKNSKSWKNNSPGVWVLLGAIPLYIGLLSYLSILRYRSYSAGMFDLGIMDQVFWNTSHGRLLTESVNMAYPLSRFWTGRWELIYIPLSLIYRWFPFTETGLILQTVFLAAGSIPIYLLAKERLGGRLLSAVMPLIYLLYPALHNANLFDIHGITFATPVFLFTFYFLWKGARFPFFLLLILLLMCREDASFLVVMLGIYAWIAMKERKTCLGLMLTGALWFLMTRHIQTIRPMFGLPPIYNPNTAPGIWGAFGGPSPVAFFSGLIHDPSLLLSRLWDVDNGKLLVKLLGPLGFIPLLSPSTLLIMLPNLILNMISSSSVLRNINHHYTSAITPVLFVSLIMGLSNLRRFFENSKNRSPFARLLERIVKGKSISVLLVVASVVCMMRWSMALKSNDWRVGHHHHLIDAVVDEIPESASLSAHFFVAPHTAHRENLYLFPDNVGEVQYVVYDLNLPYNRLMSHASQFNPPVIPLNDPLISLFHDRRYGVVTSRNGIVVFRRGADYEKGIRILAKTEPGTFTTPLSEVTSGGWRLVGVERVGIIGYRKDRFLHLIMIWEKSTKDSTENSKIAFTVGGEGEERTVVHEPLFGLLNGVEWKAKERIQDDLYLPIADLAGGEYLLSLHGEDGNLASIRNDPVIRFEIEDYSGI